jgi:hypothetical protein
MQGNNSPVEKFLSWVIHFRMDQKKAIRVLTLVGMFQTGERLAEFVDAALASVQSAMPGVARNLGEIAVMMQDDRVLQHVREAWQNSIRRAAGVPEEVLNLIRDFDELNAAVKEYVGAEDDTIKALKEAMDAANARKVARIEEVRGVRNSVANFNKARSGVLTEHETAQAVAHYTASADLRARMTETAFLDLCKARKAAANINQRLQSFRDYNPGGRATGLRERLADIPSCADTLHQLAGGAAEPPAGAGQAAGGQPPPDEEMDDAGDFPDPEGDFRL